MNSFGFRALFPFLFLLAISSVVSAQGGPNPLASQAETPQQSDASQYDDDILSCDSYWLTLRIFLLWLDTDDLEDDLTVQSSMDASAQLQPPTAEPIWWEGDTGMADTEDDTSDDAPSYLDLMLQSAQLSQFAPLTVPVRQELAQLDRPASSPSPALVDPPDDGQFTLVMRNGEKIQAVAFTHRKDNIVYVGLDGATGVIAVEDFDFQATMEINQERGIPLRLSL